jgi:hypothetical protein
VWEAASYGSALSRPPARMKKDDGMGPVPVGSRTV